MSEIVAVGIVSLSSSAIRALYENGISTLNELMVQRDLGLLTSENYDSVCLSELLDACEKIERFNESLNRDVIPDDVKKAVERTKKEAFSAERKRHAVLSRKEIVPTHTENDNTSVNGKQSIFEGIKKDLEAIVNGERLTSVRKAILKIFCASDSQTFDRKTIKKMAEKNYYGPIPINSDTIRSTLSSLKSHGFVKRVIIADSVCYMRGEAFNEVLNTISNKKILSGDQKLSYVWKSELDAFLDRHIGKEIEFRYKTERPRSEKRWRRERVYDYNDKYLLVTGCYLSGLRIQYLKERIVEYREVRE